jgi:transcription initiation factor IIE alpha subunit
MCRLFGHKYTLKRNITPYLREIKCERCGKEFGINDETKSVLPLDNELKKLHRDLLTIK